MAEQESALAGLVARLEVAVQRLERLDPKIFYNSSPPRSGGGAPLPTSVPAPLPVPSPSASSSGDAPSVVAFRELLESTDFGVARLVAVAEKIGGQVLVATKLLQEAFVAEYGIVRAISQCKQPDLQNLQQLIKPLAGVITKAFNLTEGRRTDAYNHLKTVQESMSALSWVVYTGKDCGLSLPGPHVDESWQAAEFYNNKVLMEFRGKDENQADWAKSIKALFTVRLKDYVKKYHTTGPAWNPLGIEVAQFHAGGGSDVQKRASPAPPPPPKAPLPPPPPPVGIPPPSGVNGANGKKPTMSAVFQELNKGEAVTSGLRKVTDDMKTKNRADRSGAVPAGSATPGKDGGNGLSSVSARIGTPKLELQQERKWVVEYQDGNKSIVIENCNPRQSVYVYACKNSVIQVKGKVNNITIDKCSKSGLVFQDVVAACEIVNSTSVEVQCQGTAPTIAVDNTNGCQLYLSQTSLSASITTAKSSEINVLVPGATENDDLVELALPEQFLNVYQNGQFVTTPVAHSGG